MGTESIEDRSGAEYLAQLLKDKKQIQAFPNVFIHLERLLDDEINKVRVTLFNLEKKPIQLPDEEGPKVTEQEKLFVPVKEHPEFNFVGRILGPRGITAKQLERDTGCKIMVRGKGSMRDKKKEEQMKGKPNWEHLSEELHVLVVVEDTQRRAEVKMQRAVDEIKRLLVPAPEGEDDLKKIQLMELAIMNGTYKDQTRLLQAAQQSQLQTRLMGQPIIPNATMPAFNLALQNQLLRHHPPAVNSHMGAPSPYALLSQRMGSVATSVAAFQPGLASASDAAHAQAQLYTQAFQGTNASMTTTQQDYNQYQLMSPTTLVDYPYAMDRTAAGAIPKVRRAVAAAPHPYQRA